MKERRCANPDGTERFCSRIAVLKFSVLRDDIPNRRAFVDPGTAWRGATKRAPEEETVKVLIAEDEPLFRKLLSQLLSSEFDLTVTEDGTTALANLQQENGPVLAILDWVMPGLTGLEVCRQLRARRQTAGTYVILLTARNSAADIVAGLREGADDYVTKPVQPEELRARVQLGCRIIELRAALKTEMGALAVALAKEKLLLSRLALMAPQTHRRESKKGVPALV
jgi:DNA-binding response OmpR family regulator